MKESNDSESIIRLNKNLIVGASNKKLPPVFTRSVSQEAEVRQVSLESTDLNSNTPSLPPQSFNDLVRNNYGQSKLVASQENSDKSILSSASGVIQVTQESNSSNSSTTTRNLYSAKDDAVPNGNIASSVASLTIDSGVVDANNNSVSGTSTATSTTTVTTDKITTENVQEPKTPSITILQSNSSIDPTTSTNKVNHKFHRNEFIQNLQLQQKQLQQQQQHQHQQQQLMGQHNNNQFFGMSHHMFGQELRIPPPPLLSLFDQLDMKSQNIDHDSSSFKQMNQDILLKDLQLQQRYQEIQHKEDELRNLKCEYVQFYEAIERAKMEILKTLSAKQNYSSDYMFGMNRMNNNMNHGFAPQQQLPISNGIPTMNVMETSNSNNKATNPFSQLTSESKNKPNRTTITETEGSQPSSGLDALAMACVVFADTKSNDNSNNDSNNNIQKEMQHGLHQSKKAKLDHQEFSPFNSHSLINHSMNGLNAVNDINKVNVPYRINKPKTKKSSSLQQNKKQNNSKQSELTPSRIKSNNNLQRPRHELEELLLQQKLQLQQQQQQQLQNQQPNQSNNTNPTNEITNTSDPQNNQLSNNVPYTNTINQSTCTSPLLVEKVAPFQQSLVDDFPTNFFTNGGVSKWSLSVTINDVLCGRGGLTNNHPGNVFFRSLVRDRQEKYLFASKRDKALVAHGIVDVIRQLDPPGRFLKKMKDDGKYGKNGSSGGDNNDDDNEMGGEGGYWVEIGNKKAREKTSQALREKAPELMEMLQKDFESHKHQNALMNSYNGVANGIGGIGGSTMNKTLTGMNGGNNVMVGNSGSNNGGHVVNGLNMTMQLPKQPMSLSQQHNLTPQISEETISKVQNQDNTHVNV